MWSDLATPGTSSINEPLQSPPPFHGQNSQATPQSSACFQEENFDILLPTIPDDLDDEDVFGTRRPRLPQRKKLTFRPRNVSSPLPLAHDCMFQTIESSAAQRVLIPLLHGEEESSTTQLSMKTSSSGNIPVYDSSC